MNLLQMLQFVQGNIGTSVDLPFAGPTTTLNPSGQYLEFQNFIAQAYKTIQLDNQNWRFRTRSAIIPLNVGQNFYTLGQIQAVAPSYEDIVHLHFYNDQPYGLIANHKAGAAATVTNGAVTSSAGTYRVPVTNVANYQPLMLCNVAGGSSAISGYIQSVVGSAIYFAADQLVLDTLATSMPIGAAVTPATTGGFEPDVASQTFCLFIEYQNWRGWKDRNTLPIGKPFWYTKTPDQGIEFNPVPDATNAPYFFYFDYRTQIDEVTLAVDTWTPRFLPPRYHEAICWRAIMYWARIRKKAEDYASAKIEYDRIYEKMVIEQLPDIEPCLSELYG